MLAQAVAEQAGGGCKRGAGNRFRQAANELRASEAHLTVEMRGIDEEPLEAFLALLESKRREEPVSLTVDAVGRRRAGSLPRDAPLLLAIRAVRAEQGLPDVFVAGSTDANAALALGIPALSLGVARGSGMHTPGERIELASLAAGAAQVEGVVLRILGAVISGDGAHSDGTGTLTDVVAVPEERREPDVV